MNVKFVWSGRNISGRVNDGFITLKSRVFIIRVVKMGRAMIN